MTLIELMMVLTSAPKEWHTTRIFVRTAAENGQCVVEHPFSTVILEPARPGEPEADTRRIILSDS